MFLRDYGETEIGGFGVTSPEDLLYVRDVRLVRQECSWSHVEFDDAAVADFFDEQVDAGCQPEQFARVWCHTHPGNSARPSGTDEETFERVFGICDWACMFIVACQGQTYARLRFNLGPGGEMKIPVEVAYDEPFSGTDYPAWEQEYWESVQPLVTNHGTGHVARNLLDLEDEFPIHDPFLDAAGTGADHLADDWLRPDQDYLNELLELRKEGVYE